MLSIKKVYNHVAEQLRRGQQEHVHYEEWRCSHEAATNEAQHQQSHDRVRSQDF
jgi:hypothetical protein